MPLTQSVNSVAATGRTFACENEFKWAILAKVGLFGLIVSWSESYPELFRSLFYPLMQTIRVLALFIEGGPRLTISWDISDHGPRIYSINVLDGLPGLFRSSEWP